MAPLVRLRDPQIGEHPLLAGKTPVFADFQRNPVHHRRTLNSCKHMMIGEAEVSIQASFRR
jgi:hypothetical protein